MEPDSEDEYINRVGNKQDLVQCYCCGKRGHVASQCRFRNYKCYKCGRNGHLQVVCGGDKKKTVDKQSRPKTTNTNIKQLQEEEAYEDHIWGLTGGHKEGYRLLVAKNGKPLQMELDTGATVSVISEAEWHTLFKDTIPLEPYTGPLLRGYSGHQLEVAGQATVEVTYEQQKASLPLVVIAGMQRPALFGRNWLAVIKVNWSALHKIQGDKLQHILAKHRALFQQGIGTIQGYKADVRLQPNTKPVFKKSRPVAYALQPALDKELQCLQQAGILEPVRSSEWATPLVAIPKTNGRLRVCGDYKVTINQNIEKKVYPLPTAEDLFTKLAGGKIFSKLDMSQAYQQLLLDDDSEKLLVVNTPRGLFQYTRLPYGSPCNISICNGSHSSRVTSSMLSR